MLISQKRDVQFAMTRASIIQALKNSGYDDNTVVAFAQDDNLVLFKDDVNNDYLVNNIFLELVPVVKGVSASGGFNVMVTNEIQAEYGGSLFTYNADPLYTDEMPDPMDPIKLEDLGHTDVFYMGLIQSQPEMITNDDAPGVLGVCEESKLVLLATSDRAYEYSYRIVPNPEDPTIGHPELYGMPVRTWVLEK